jgi:hypothetical protein
MLYRALDFKTATSGNFGDVPAGSYYYDAIAAAKALGIAKGDGAYFYPKEPLTRQDAMVFIYRALDAMNISIGAGSSSDLAAYGDGGSVSSYAVNAVAALVKAGVIQGDGANIYPGNILTRAQMAAILYRVLTM